MYIYIDSDVNYVRIDTSSGTLCKIFVNDFVIFTPILNASKEKIFYQYLDYLYCTFHYTKMYRPK